ncbi:cryptochrome/photolyase family protein [Candidatus Protochlamydia sp. W-9]|uniref:cryptochrome/photolyase family protein n=1 Tax=Candidatus Protochlamydia sp. W-9 TaxID=1785087 RepID=UPI00096AB789|nr:deoxyribodipyrimidine photo-lyase [Candidatus Protochlamydia sp. W-9]
MANPSIVWFRQDLRLEDNPALNAAAQKGGPVIPVFNWVFNPEKEWQLGGASQWWLYYSLISLKNDLSELGLSLIIRKEDPLKSLLEIAHETGADTIYWNRRYEPMLIQDDAKIKTELQKQGIKAHSFNGNLLFEPWTIANKQGKPFQVFTPFWNQCLKLNDPKIPLPVPHSLKKIVGQLQTESIDSLNLLPKIKWDKGLKEVWSPGAKNAKALLKKGLTGVIDQYLDIRDLPDHDGTSLLSPYLHFGEISPRMIWQAVKENSTSKGAEGYLRQIGWREFAHHLLYHFPETPQKPLRSQFNSFSWKNDKQNLKAWQKGQTGYPIIDAGMRQLWKIGWMHNRVRLIVGSFLVKDLMTHWIEGAKWFWDTLVDADLANNTMGWQWIAGCGADAAPYFRIFNPITQGEKFDPEGNYVKKWVPELINLPKKWLHQPWEAPEEILRQSGIELGINYPKPIVNHAKAREEALQAYARL